MQYYSIGPCFYHQSHPQLGIVFALAPSLHSFWSYFSTDLHPTQRQRPAEPKINRYVKIVLKGVIFHLLERSELHKCGMWNFLHRFVFSPTFVSYSIMYLYQYGFRCLFYTVDYSPILLYFVAQIIASLTIPSSFQFSSVTQLCLTLCDSMDCNTPVFSVHHQLPEPTQTHVHYVGDVIQAPLVGFIVLLHIHITVFTFF